MKKSKVLMCSMLSLGLVVTPIGSLLDNNKVLAKSNYNQKTDSIVITREDLKIAIDKMYQNKEISKEQYNKAKNLLMLKGFWGGKNDVVPFPDGSFDLYVNGFICDFILTLGITGAAGKLLSYIPKLGKLFKGKAGLLAGAFGSTTLSHALDVSNGMIFYFKRGTIWDETAGQWVNSYYLHHFRRQ